MHMTREKAQEKKPLGKVLTAGIGFLVGVLNGFLGAGGGMLAVPLLKKQGLAQKQAHATAIAVIFPLTLVSAAVYVLGGKVNLPDAVNRVVTDRFISLIAFALDPEMLCNATFRVSDEGKKYISAAYYTGKPLVETEVEEILKLHPDVILMANMNGNTKEDADAMQRKLNIPVLMVDFEIHDYRQTYSFLGQALNRTDAAGRIIAFLDRYLIPLNEKSKTIVAAKRQAVYYAEGLLGVNTEPSGSFHSQVIDYLNATNVARAKIGSVHGMSEVSMEQLLQWNPELIVVWSGMPSGMGLPGQKQTKSTFEHITTDPVWAKVAAVKSGKVYQVPSLPFGWFDRPPSSNCIPGALWLAKVLYPDVFDFDMNAVLKEYFRLFYHTDIGTEEVATLYNSDTMVIQ
jgi:iron complex transport system substrate-binding protein